MPNSALLPNLDFSSDFASYKILAHRAFYFNRIQIYLIHDTHLDIITIAIVDTLIAPHTKFFPYGMFITQSEAFAKFNSINL